LDSNSIYNVMMNIMQICFLWHEIFAPIIIELVFVQKF